MPCSPHLTGIPVYQQQLVWAGLELQDEFCLEEYSIPSGAQLKLLVAMRGGPIHAQRGNVCAFTIGENLNFSAVPPPPPPPPPP